jgi:hypothetical protein
MSTLSIQTCLVIIKILITDLEEDAVVAGIGIKGVDQGEQGIGSRLKGLGFQIITLSLVTLNLLSSPLLLQLSLMGALLCFQDLKANSQIPNAVKSFVFGVISRGHITRFCPDRRPHAYMTENFTTSPSPTTDVANIN